MSGAFLDDEQEQAEAQNQAAKSHRAIEQADVAEVLANPAARRLLRRLILGRCGILRHTFDADARLDALKQGERNAGLWMLAELSKVEPKALAVLMQEPEHTEKSA